MDASTAARPRIPRDRAISVVAIGLGLVAAAIDVVTSARTASDVSAWALVIATGVALLGYAIAPRAQRGDASAGHASIARAAGVLLFGIASAARSGELWRDAPVAVVAIELGAIALTWAGVRRASELPRLDAEREPPIAHPEHVGLAAPDTDPAPA